MYSLSLSLHNHEWMQAVIFFDSRDTTVKLWDLEEMREVRSLGGHTGAVTSVVLLPTTSSNNICESNFKGRKEQACYLNYSFDPSKSKKK